MNPDLSRPEARRLALAAQCLAVEPPGRAGSAEILDLLSRIATIQLDAINVLERTQFLVLFARLGAYERADLHALTGPRGELWEYWGHEASLQAVTMEPLLRWRMAQHRDHDWGGPKRRAVWTAWNATNAEYIEAVLEEVRELGPIPASKLTDPRPRQGEWWGRRSVGRQTLEWLFAAGLVSGWRSRSFERVYDVPERVIPPAVLDSPTPPAQDAQRQLALVAVRALGVGTATDVANYFELPVRTVEARLAELVAAAEVEAVSVDGWSRPAYRVPGLDPSPSSRERAALLSPFDSLIWFRDRAKRLWDLDYRIEVYTPAPQRVHGYYVLPVLVGEAIVGRLDLKADRHGSALRVQAAFAEPGVKPRAVAGPIAAELRAMQAWLGLSSITVADRGDLAPALAVALRGRRGKVRV